MSELKAPPVYHADPVTGEYSGQSFADPDPLEEDNWLVPGNSFLDQPPEAGKNKVPVRKDGAWILVDDFRGTVYYLGSPEPKVIVDLGVKVPEGATDAPPPPTADQLSVAERAWRDVEIERIKWLRERHRDESDMGIPTTLTSAQFSELLTYIQALRDWPESKDFPNRDKRPVSPEWIARQTQ